MHNKVVKLAIAAVVALLLAVWAGVGRQPQESMPELTALAPGLREGLNDITRVRLTGAASAPIVTLEKGESGWKVTEKSGYPADIVKVREFLLKLADATLVEQKTADPELHAKLGVEDIGKADAKGALLEIEGLKEPVKLIIGNYNGQGGDSTFVRRADDNQSWLAKGNFTVDKTSANWLRRDLVDVATNRIEEVAITADGKTLRVFKSKPDDANYTVADIPRGREVSSEFVANGLASVLSGLRFDDVMPAGSAEPGQAKVFDARYRFFDGLEVRAEAWEVDGKDYARFSASVDEARAATAVEAEQAKARSQYETAKAAAEAEAKATADAAKSAEGDTATAAAANAATPAAAPAVPEAPLAVSDPAKDRDERLAKLRTEAEEMNKTFEGWTFVIPSFKYANMNKTMDDMLKPKS
jgi:hypothetical protein